MNLTALQTLAVGLALALVPTAAQANVIFQSEPIDFNASLGPTAIPGAPAGTPPAPGVPLVGVFPLVPPGEAVFGQFDASGSLNSATWRLRAVIGFDYSHHANAIVGVPLPIPTPFGFGLTAGGALSLSLLIPGVDPTDSQFVAAGGPTVKNCSGFATQTPVPGLPPLPFDNVECVVDTSGDIAIDASFIVTGSDLAQFIGAGDISVPFLPTAEWFSLPLPLGVAPLPFPVSFVNGSFGGEGTLELTYDFTPAQVVPLPATPLLVGAGLLGLALSRRLGESRKGA